MSREIKAQNVFSVSRNCVGEYTETSERHSEQASKGQLKVATTPLCPATVL